MSGARRKGRVLRKKNEGSATWCQGRDGTGYKQGVRVGVFGVLSKSRLLCVAFLPEGRITGTTHAALVKKHYKQWAGKCVAVMHDGEKAFHTKIATEAYRVAKVQMLKIPPSSPDVNPIENVWAMLDHRLEETRPAGFERVPGFKKRVCLCRAWVVVCPPEGSDIPPGGINSPN